MGNVGDIIHVTIKTLELEATEKFYTEVLQAKIGPRPDLGVPGLWLDFNGTQVHILAGEAALDADGNYKSGSGAFDLGRAWARTGVFHCGSRFVLCCWRRACLGTANFRHQDT